MVWFIGVFMTLFGPFTFNKHDKGVSPWNDPSKHKPCEYKHLFRLSPQLYSLLLLDIQQLAAILINRPYVRSIHRYVCPFFCSFVREDIMSNALSSFVHFCSRGWYMSNVRLHSWMILFFVCLFSGKDIIQALLAFQSFPPYCFVVVSWYLYSCVYGNKSYEMKE